VTPGWCPCPACRYDPGVAVFVALLRGINVGKSRRVAMADLRAVLEEAGYPDITTHLQSGNVVLETRTRQAGAVEQAIEKALRKKLDLEIDVVVRTASQLAKVMKSNPFLERRVDPATLLVGFLKAKPKAADARALARTDFGGDEFVLRGTELYLRYPKGYGRSKMNGAYFERALRIPITVRNWKVVTKLTELAGLHDQELSWDARALRRRGKRRLGGHRGIAWQHRRDGDG
jgi:uncharacterized protein (DUF1697 family)